VASFLWYRISHRDISAEQSKDGPCVEFSFFPRRRFSGKLAVVVMSPALAKHAQHKGACLLAVDGLYALCHFKMRVTTRWRELKRDFTLTKPKTVPPFSAICSAHRFAILVGVQHRHRRTPLSRVFCSHFRLLVRSSRESSLTISAGWSIVFGAGIRKLQNIAI
jgi:hypothetical protein